MASHLRYANLDVAPAVGSEAASEFLTFVQIYKDLPNLAQILNGLGGKLRFSREPSVRYATAIGLAVRANTAQQGLNAFRWISAIAPPEWVQLFATDLFRQMQAKKQLGELAQLVQQDPSLKAFLEDFQSLLTL